MSNDRPVTREYQNDEIDLFELLQTLWQEKLLIAVVTFFCTCIAALYVFTVQPQYSVSMTLKPASLALYGDFIAGMKGEKEENIALGRSTAEQVLGQLKHNLELSANQSGYFKDRGMLGLSVVSRSAGVVTLTLRTLQSESAVQTLLGYVDFAGEVTLKELNAFWSGLGHPAGITQEMLYIVDSIPSQAQLDKPKKRLIIALGVVIGGMLGVFFALVRSMLRKRGNVLIQYK